MSAPTRDRVRGVAGGRRARAGERLLACEGLFHLYMLEGREVVALQGVDFGVDWCEMVALLGPSANWGMAGSATRATSSPISPPQSTP